MTNDPNGAVPQKKEVLFHGIPASPGISIGTVLVVGRMKAQAAANEKRILTDPEIETELGLFRNALKKTREEIQALQKHAQGTLDRNEAGIFDAHLLIIEDKMLSAEVENAIRTKRQPAQSAFNSVVTKYLELMSDLENEYLQERAEDIRDISGRILDNLSGFKRQSLDKLPGPTIVVAHNLTPSDTIQLDRENILGFAIETGSRTSHTAILARAIRIPAVVGLQHIAERFVTGDTVIVDGFLGMVILNPTGETIDFYKQKIEKKDELFQELERESPLCGETLDGYRVQLLANTEGDTPVQDFNRYGAEGIGLFRTEFLYLKKTSLPPEEEQYRIYRDMAKAVFPRNVVIRTIDIGGDKLDANVGSFHDPNPYLGLRAIRLSREQPELQMTQIRAILRAGADTNISMLFPMISSLEEFEDMEKMVEEAGRQLTAEHIPYDVKMKLGAMIEIPSAALLADKLAERADFFSIGTNDLVQYTLAVDRTNEKVAYLYKPSHPAVLALIAMTAKAAHHHKIPVSVCGELAADPLFTPIFLGLGIQKLSMSPASIGPVRRVIRRLHFHQAEKIAEAALESRTADDALAASKQLLAEIAPDIFSLPG